jgi:hypothetical protein
VNAHGVIIHPVLQELALSQHMSRRSVEKTLIPTDEREVKAKSHESGTSCESDTDGFSGPDWC